MSKITMTEPNQPMAAPAGGADLLDRGELTLLDLSIELSEETPLWPGHQRPFMFVNQDHEAFKRRWETTFGFEAHNWLISEHTGTHTDAILEYLPGGQPLERMPLEYYYGEAICLDVSHVRHPDWLTADVLAAAEQSSPQSIRPGDIVLLHTGHMGRTFPTKEFITTYTGLSRDGAQWLADKGVVNIGVDAVAIDHSDDLEFAGHDVCGQTGMVNTENLANLDKLIDKRFIYFGLPLPFRQGTGSPIRAVAWLRDGV
jgi:kynurenine formamidase